MYVQIQAVYSMCVTRMGIGIVYKEENALDFGLMLAFHSLCICIDVLITIMSAIMALCKEVIDILCTSIIHFIICKMALVNKLYIV